VWDLPKERVQTSFRFNLKAAQIFGTKEWKKVVD